MTRKLTSNLLAAVVCSLREHSHKCLSKPTSVLNASPNDHLLCSIHYILLPLTCGLGWPCGSV